MGMGARLQTLLNDRKCTPIKLARETGIPQQTIYSILKRDSSRVSIDHLLKICKYFDVSPELFHPKRSEAEDTADAGSSDTKLSDMDQEFIVFIEEARREGVTVHDLRLAMDFLRRARAKDSL